MPCFIVQRRKKKKNTISDSTSCRIGNLSEFAAAQFLLFFMSETFLDIGLQAMSHNHNAEKTPYFQYSPNGHKELDMTEVTACSVHLQCQKNKNKKTNCNPVKLSYMVFVSTFPKNPNFQSFITSANRTSEKVIPSVVIMSDIAQAQARHVKLFHLQYFFASLCLL